MKQVLIKEYLSTSKLLLPPRELPMEAEVSFTDGPKCTIRNGGSHSYKVDFIDSSNNRTVYSTTVTNGMWTKANLKYFVPWYIKVTNLSTNEVVWDYNLDLNNQRVYIKFESKAIGDTIAWLPYVEEFRKKHNCKVLCSTFHNKWFESTYPNIEFTPPGNDPYTSYTYRLGWFFKEGKFNTQSHKLDPLSIPLQRTATDILGLSFREIKPKLKVNPTSLIPKEKYVTISTQSTCQAKYWNHPTGWSQVIKHVQNKGYKVAVVDKHRTFGIHKFMNTAPQADFHFHGKSLEEITAIINESQLHIGIGSGLSWLSWALDTPTMLISSFSQPYSEFTNCTRIYTPSPTTGYFNTHKLDPSNWNWYPFKKIESMEDWHEIETITPDLVIENLDRIL